MPGGSFAQFGVGNGYHCGMRTDGTLTCWGNVGTLTPPAGTYNQLAVGWFHGCARKADGHLACWGRSDENQTTPP